MAAERRQNKAQARQSPPRRPSYSGYNDDRDPRPRSRSPMHGRDSRDMRDHRDVREPVRDSGRDHRSSHPRDHDPRDSHYERYRGSQSREKDLRNPSYRDDYERYYRGDDYYRKREEPYPERYKEPWNGRRESEEERPRPEERRRNELYRQYYEELQRRYDTERPVDCSVIVVNKQQKEYAETVGRKVRDLGMVVDLIFLNTEVSLTQALEDVGRARTPFAIIITQQHQVHRSCTVNILFGTPQEHRNMPMQDAMVLVAQNYDHFKAEHRDKERDELARKAAKMADEVLMREHEREGHPVSVLTSITLLAEGRYLTREELDGLINYLQDKRDGNVRSSGDQLSGSRPIAAVSALEAQSAPSSAQSIPSTPLNSQVSQLSHTSQALHPTTHTSHLIPGLTATLPSNPLPAGTSHQQDLQAKILSLFNSGASSTPSPVATPTQTYSSTVGAQTTMPQTVVPKLAQPGAPRPALRPQVVAPEYGALGRVVTQQATQRPLTTGTGFNFDNPSVQKALDTLIQSGSSINHLVNSASQSAPRQTQGVAQSTSLSLYPRHY